MSWSLVCSLQACYRAVSRWVLQLMFARDFDATTSYAFHHSIIVYTNYYCFRQRTRPLSTWESMLNAPPPMNVRLRAAKCIVGNPINQDAFREPSEISCGLRLVCNFGWRIDSFERIGLHIICSQYVIILFLAVRVVYCNWKSIVVRLNKY